MQNIAIIPARSGSKGLPDKNIKELLGKPLMAYSIEAAVASGCFNEVMVSTDSEHYAEIAKSYGANVPFFRSEATSSDTASSWGMVDEVLRNYKSLLGREFDTFCLLQPTSPLRTAEDIKSAYKLYEEQAKFAVVSVCETEHSPLWSGQLPKNHEFIDFIKPDTAKRRQDAGKFYRLNGAIYIVNIAHFRADTFLYTKGSFAFIMEQKHSIDIDTELDFSLAETILRKNSTPPPA